MDLATIIGLVISFGLVVSAIMMGGSIMTFVSVQSVFIVVGGTIGATLVQYPLARVLNVFGVARHTFFTNAESPGAVIEKFMEYANRARREGILSLEPSSRRSTTVF